MSLHSLLNAANFKLVRRGSWIKEEPENHIIWEEKRSIAFWASVVTMQGALLFVYGSYASYPSFIVTDAANKEYVRTAWVDYSYMIGAWMFTISNYLVYFQVINKMHDHEKAQKDDTLQTKLCFLAWPEKDKGHLAAILNVLGAICYNIETMSMFGADKSSSIGFFMWYVLPGTMGSLCFVIAACFEGEYNNWRDYSKGYFRVKRIAVWQSMCNWSGGVLFMLGYAVDFNHFADDHPEVNLYAVINPFLVGSIFFAVSSGLDLMMWKMHMFGLGFSKELSNDNDLPPREDSLIKNNRMICWKQYTMLWIYCLNVASAFVRCSLHVAILRLITYEHELICMSDVLRCIVMYEGILWLATVLHRTPDHFPYDKLLWLMRIVAVFDLCRQWTLLWFFQDG